LSDGERCSKSARKKLKAPFFQAWNETVTLEIRPSVGVTLIIQEANGFTAHLMNKEEMVKHFGTQENQHGGVPVARLMQVYDVLNGLTVKADIYSIKMLEQ
jgi:hypothetical protein